MFGKGAGAGVLGEQGPRSPLHPFLSETLSTPPQSLHVPVPLLCLFNSTALEIMTGQGSDIPGSLGGRHQSWVL